jgi:predicted transcriptional regulator of viral defense system
MALRRVDGHIDPEVVEAGPASNVDHAIARLASSQHGVVSRHQLLEIGLSLDEIRRRRECGRLHPAHRGVYLVGHIAVTDHGRWLAAVLACGEGALLSHRFAAALWGLAQPAAARIEVTVGPGGRSARSGIAVHRSSTLLDEERTTRHGIPVTSVARTLLDLASVVSPTQLHRAFEAADRLELLDVDALATLCRRTSGRRGTGQLRDMLREHRGPAVETRSALEHRFLRLCQRAGLPPPAVNVPVQGFEVDALWRRERIVVELDGYAYHRGRAAFERDRRRDSTLVLAGYQVLRVTHRRLVDQPSAVAAEIQSLLMPRR